MCGTCCLIAPPDVLLRVAEEGTAEVRDSCLRTLAQSVALRAQRAAVGNALRTLDVDIADLAFLAPTRAAHITVYDVHHGGDFDLPGERKRGDGDQPDADPE